MLIDPAIYRGQKSKAESSSVIPASDDFVYLRSLVVPIHATRQIATVAGQIVVTVPASRRLRLCYFSAQGSIGSAKTRLSIGPDINSVIPSDRIIDTAVIGGEGGGKAQDYTRSPALALGESLRAILSVASDVQLTVGYWLEDSDGRPV